MGARRSGRAAALQMLYQIDASGVTPAQAITTYWIHLGSNKEGRAFADGLIEGWAADRALIDKELGAVSQNWRVSRMPIVDRNILRLAAYELRARADIPSRVTLNEAVELAKTFGGEGSASFVNGVLDRIASDLKKK